VSFLEKNPRVYKTVKQHTPARSLCFIATTESAGSIAQNNPVEGGMSLSRRDIIQKSAAHWLALLAVLSQIILVVLCVCGPPSRSGEVLEAATTQGHHSNHAAPGVGEDNCNACRVTCGSTTLIAATFILLTLAFMLLGRERSDRAPIWAQNYSGNIFDGRAPPLTA